LRRTWAFPCRRIFFPRPGALKSARTVKGTLCFRPRAGALRAWNPARVPSVPHVLRRSSNRKSYGLRWVTFRKAKHRAHGLRILPCSQRRLTLSGVIIRCSTESCVNRRGVMRCGLCSPNIRAVKSAMPLHHGVLKACFMKRIGCCRRLRRTKTFYA
jgi:hypothetical protein